MRSIPTALSVLLFLMTYSCTSLTKKKPSESITGNWLIIFPDHRLKTIQEREVYGRHQDSIVSLYGLKLISLSTNGTFIEIDSMVKQPGKWTFAKDSLLRIQEGGKGFNPFIASFKNFDRDTLQLIQYLPLDGEKIKVVWYLKKIGDDEEAAKLFDADFNGWRKKPVAPEADKEMRKRLGAILNYYSEYFGLVSREAIYFSPARVPMPLRYYQHGMGMNSELLPDFKNLFYNDADAQKAYTILQQTMQAIDIASSGENYVIEYGTLLKRMGEKLSK